MWLKLKAKISVSHYPGGFFGDALAYYWQVSGVELAGRVGAG
jgi:hypothetical protein